MSFVDILGSLMGNPNTAWIGILVILGVSGLLIYLGVQGLKTGKTNANILRMFSPRTLAVYDGKAMEYSGSASKIPALALLVFGCFPPLAMFFALLGRFNIIPADYIILFPVIILLVFFFVVAIRIQFKQYKK